MNFCTKCARRRRLSCECPFFGEALVEIMIVRDVSRASLARESSLSAYMLRRFELNKAKPSDMTRAWLAGVLGVPNRYFSRKPPPLPDSPIFFCGYWRNASPTEFSPTLRSVQPD